MENLVKFKRSLTFNLFNSLQTKDSDTLYFISDEPKIYLGSRLVSEGNELLSNFNISTGGINGTSHAVYKPNTGGTLVTSEDITFNQSDDTHFNIGVRKLPLVLLLDVDYSDYIVDKNYVDTAIMGGLATADALTYKGVITVVKTNKPQSDIAYTPSANKGDVYKVAIANPEYPGATVINGIPVEHGDMLICNTDNTQEGSSTVNVSENWDYIQRNEDGVVSGPTSSTDNCIAVFDGTTGKVISDSSVSIDDVSAAVSSLVWS